MHQSKRVVLCVVLAAGAAGGIGACVASRVPEPAAPIAAMAMPGVDEMKPVDAPGLHNLVAYHEDFVSGSQPEGAAGFDSLRAMGVKTIISVDGAVPDVAAAKARGMRYIHLPIGYNGFDETRKRELVRATRDALRDGPVYIHCHHGKHRSAGAAAAVASSLGWATPDEGVARMKVSGTAANYTGLFACAQQASLLDAAEIDRVSPNFPEISRPSSFVQGMVEVDEVFEHLKLIEKAGWKAPQDHPDLVPAAEAGRLADIYRHLAEGAYTARKPADFGKAMRDDAALASEIEEALAQGQVEPAALSARFKLIAASCKDCHAKYRDVP